MTSPVRKSKRKMEEEGAAEAAAASEETAAAGEDTTTPVDQEEAKPPIIKKPRKDIAEAAAKAVAEEVEKEKKAGGGEAPSAAAEGVVAGQPAPVYKEEEYEEPDDGAEIEEDTDEVWNARLVTLLLYKHQYRTLHVQATYDQSLHQWVDIQRKLYRRHRKDPKLVSAATQSRLTALDAINFPFTLRGAAHWERYHAKLQEFNKKHGHCLVPRLCEFAGLGDWVIDQRRQYKLMMQGKPSVLDPERQRKLEEMGFVWVVRNRPEWNNRYSELISYREKYGDTKVPQHYKEIPGLGKWVAKQREQFRLLQQGKHSFLTPDRLEKLNDAGFVWSVRKDGADDLAAPSTKKKPAVKKEEGEDKPKDVKTESEPPKLTGGDPEKVTVVDGKAADKEGEKEEVKKEDSKVLSI